MSVSIGTVIGSLILDDRLSPALKIAEQNLLAAGKSAQRFGGDLQSAGRAMLPVSTTIAAIGAASFKFSADFETAMTKVGNITDIGIANIGKMRTAILDMAPDVGVAPKALAEGLLVVASTGLKGAEALDVLEQSAKATAVGLGETKDIARAVTAGITAYGAENLTAAEATNKLFVAVRAGGAEANQFAGSLGTVVGIASQMGVSFDEVLASVATFTRLGISADEATTALRGTITSFLNPTKEATEQVAALGTSFAELRTNVKEKGLAQTLIELVQATKGNDEAISAIIPNVRALAGVLGTAGSQAKTYIEILGQVKGSTNELDKAFGVVSDTLGFKWNAAWSRAQTVLIQFGDALAPSFNKILDAMKPALVLTADLVSAFAQLPQPVQAVAVAFGVLVAAAAPALYVAGSLVTAYGALATALGVFAGASVAATAATVLTAQAAAAAVPAATMMAQAWTTASASQVAFNLVQAQTVPMMVAVKTETIAAGAASIAAAPKVGLLATAFITLRAAILPVTLAIVGMWAAWKVGNIDAIRDGMARWVLSSNDAAANAIRLAAGIQFLPPGYARLTVEQTRATLAAQAQVDAFDADADAAKRLRDQISGIGLAKDMATLTSLAKEMAPAGTLTEGAMKRMAQAAQAMTAQGQTLSPELANVVKWVQMLEAAATQAGSGLQVATGAAKKFQEDMQNAAEGLGVLELRIQTAQRTGTPLILMLELFGQEALDAAKEGTAMGLAVGGAVRGIAAAFGAADLDEYLKKFGYEMKKAGASFDDFMADQVKLLEVSHAATVSNLNLEVAARTRASDTLRQLTMGTTEYQISEAQRVRDELIASVDKTKEGWQRAEAQIIADYNATILKLIAIHDGGMVEMVDATAQLADAYHFFGLKTHEELNLTAEKAKAAYAAILKDGKATPAEIRVAFEEMNAAIARSNNQLATSFTDLLGGLAQSFQQLSQISGGNLSAIAQDIANIFGAMAAGSKAGETLDAGLDNLDDAFKDGKFSAENFAVGLASVAAGALAAVAALDQATSSTSKARNIMGGAATGAQIGGSIYPGAGHAVGAGVGALVGWARGIGAPTEKEVAGRGVAGQFREDMIAMITDAQKAEAQIAISAGANAVWAQSFIVVRDAYLAVGKTAEEAMQDMDNLWKSEVNGAEATAIMVERINAVLTEHEQQLLAAALAAETLAATQAAVSAAGFQSSADLQALADTAREVYEYMAEAGIYSAEQVQAAWEASAHAQAVAIGDAAALGIDAAAAAGFQTQAGLQALADKAKYVYDFMLASGLYTAQQLAAALQASAEAQATALGIIEAAIPETLGEAAAAMGYKTQAELQAIADKAKAVYEYMEASGLYTASAIAEALKASAAAQEAALGDVGKAASDMIDKLQADYDSLAKSIEGEAPEAVMGSVEKATRAKMAIVQAQIDEQEQALALAAESTAAVGVETGTALETAEVAAADMGATTVQAASDGQAAMENLRVMGIDPAAEAFTDMQARAGSAFAQIISDADIAIGRMEALAAATTAVAEGESPGGYRGVAERAREAHGDITRLAADGTRGMDDLSRAVDGVGSSLAQQISAALGQPFRFGENEGFLKGLGGVEAIARYLREHSTSGGGGDTARRVGTGSGDATGGTDGGSDDVWTTRNARGDELRAGDGEGGRHVHFHFPNDFKPSERTLSFAQQFVESYDHDGGFRTAVDRRMGRDGRR